MPTKDSKVFWLLILATLLVRFPLFFPSLLDHDESTYMVIGSEILKGKDLYVDVIDLKPPGVFWFFALIEGAFGKSIFLVRIVDALLIGISAFLLFKIQRRFNQSENAGWFTAFLFILMNTLHFFTLSFNNEHLMVLFALLAIWILLRKETVWTAFLCGLFAGLGFIVKYLVLFDVAAFGVFFLVLTWQRTKSWAEVVKWALTRGTAMLLGFVIPMGLTILYFYVGDHFEAFQFISFEAPGNYAEETSWFDRLRFLTDFNIAYLFYLIPFYWMIFGKVEKESWKQLRWLALIWLGFTMLSVEATGKMFSHYWLQMVPPVVLISGLAIDHLKVFKKIKSFKWKGWNGLQWSGLSILIFGIALNYFTEVRKPDYPKIISNYLKEEMKPGDEVFPANTYQILYYLLDQSPIIPYVHSSLLIREGHVKTLEIDLDYWFNFIKEKSPRFIMVADTYKIESFQQFIEENYKLKKTFDNRFHIWELEK
ncbi:MAG: glycosyltransferase family 39 protein [Saprospiraceae bacterium]